MKKQYTEKKLGELAENIIELTSQMTYILLYGTPGSGKTTLVSKIFEKMGVKEHITSPTYSILNSYYQEKNHLVHADLYRISSIEELEMTGFLML